MVKTNSLHFKTEKSGEGKEGTMTSHSENIQKADKSIFSKGRHKRLSNATEANLHSIIEKDEELKQMKSFSKKSIINLNSCGEKHIHVEYTTQEFTATDKSADFETNEKLLKKNGTEYRKHIKYKNDLQNRKVCHGYEPECEGLYEEEMNTAEVTERSNMDHVNKKEGNKSGVKCEKSIKSNTVIPTLDLSSLSSDTDSSDTKHINATESKKMPLEDTSKNMDYLPSFPDLKHTCVHGNINLTPRKGESLYQTLKQGQKRDTTPRKCILCDINGASFKTKTTESDYDKLLVEIIYPHEFYDRYSRAGKKTNDIKEKEVISICHPAKVLPKPKPRQRMSPVPSAPTSTPEATDRAGTEGLQDEDAIKEVVTGEIEDENDKTEKHKYYLYEPRETIKTEFHEHCRGRLNDLVITEHTEDQKRLLRGMKGYLSHRDKDAKGSPKDVKRSEYNISSLGIQFSLPDYNTSLRSRREPTSRPGTQQTAYTPRQAAPYLPLARPFNLKLSPRQAMIMSTPRQEVITPMDDVGTRPTAPAPSVEDIVKSFDTNRSPDYSVDLTTNKSSSGYKSVNSSHKHKVRIGTEEFIPDSKLTLPPLPSALRSRPLRSSLTSGPITLGGVTL